MFEGDGIPDEFTGDWVFADGEWHPEIYDPIDLDPADLVCGATVPIPSCPTGAGLAIMLAGFDNAQVPDAGVLDRIVGFERLLAWAAAGQARALAELSTRRTAHDVNELPYAVEEVALALSCSRIAAGSKVALATDLAGRLLATLSAWEQGRICAARARVLSEGTQRLSAEDATFVEDQLLEAAQTLSPARLKVKVTALADSLDPREIEDRHIDAAAGRRVIKEPREDGMACLWALLPADQAATVWAGITARAEADHEPDDPRTADQRRADALTDLATCYLSGATTIDPVTGETGTPPRVPAWAQIQVKFDAGLLLGTSTEPATLRGHGPIPASMAIRIAADAQWQRIVYDPSTGALLDVGTTRHDPPRALREYVLARLIPGQRCGLRTVRTGGSIKNPSAGARPDLHLGQLRATPRRPRPRHPLPRRPDRRAQPRRQMPTPPPHQTTPELPHRTQPRRIHHHHHPHRTHLHQPRPQPPTAITKATARQSDSRAERG